MSGFGFQGGGAPEKFKQDIPVVLAAGKSFGKYVDGDIIPATGLTPVEVITMANSELFAPTAVLSLNQSSTSLEIGQTVNVTITTTYTANDAGALTSLEVRRDGAPIGATTPYVDNNVVINAVNKAYQSTVNYAAGNLPAGSIITNTVNLRGYYRQFYGPVAATPANSAQVRALPSSRLTVAGNVFTLNTGTVQNRYTVAIPDTQSITQVIDLDALNANITAQYVQLADIVVNDAGGNPVTYHLYEMVQAVPYSENHRHQITVA